VEVVRNEDLSPQLRLATLDEITSLLLEHRVVVGNGNKLIITKAFCIGNICQVWVSGFAELSNDERLVELDRTESKSQPIFPNPLLLAYVILFKERFRVAVAIDINLSHSIKHRGVLAAILHAIL
jgi:hypothetical protein